MLGLSRRRTRHVASEINITPFTDVVLVLLIIFMLMTPLLSQSGAGRSDSGFSVDLPRATTGGFAGKGGKVTIMLLRDGKIVVEDEEITEGTLEDRLRKSRDENPDLMVVVQADRMANHWRVVRLMNLATKLGIKRLGIATDEEDGDNGEVDE